MGLSSPASGPATDFQPGFNILTDHRDLTEYLTTDQAHRIVDLVRSLSAHLAHARWAVVTSHPASVGMVNMLASLVEPVPLHVMAFQETAPAQAWLDGAAGGEDVDAEVRPGAGERRASSERHGT